MPFIFGNEVHLSCDISFALASLVKICCDKHVIMLKNVLALQFYI